MKTSLLPFFIMWLTSNLIFAQAPFKGTINYELKYSIDESTKQQMEQLGITLPNNMQLISNGSDARMKMLSAKGVIMEFGVSKGESYLLDKPSKIAYKMPKEEKKETEQKPTVTKTNEFLTVAGYKCRKYVLEEKSGKGKQYIWAAADFKFSNALFSNLEMKNSGYSAAYEEIDGIPLKIEVISEENLFTSQAISITTTSPTEDKVKIPADFAIEEFSPMIMGKIMMRGPVAE